MRRLGALILLGVLLGGCGTPGQGLSSSESKSLQAERDIISRVSGDSPNFAQMSNGTLMTVVSRDFGRGSKPGALVELYYPLYARDNLWDSYVGVTAQGKLRWAHDLRLVRQALVPDTGIAVSTFEGPGYRLTISDLVRPGRNAHVRHLSVTNTSAQPLTELAATCYAFFTLNNLPGGDRLHYDRSSGALLQTNKGISVALASDRTTGAWQCGNANQPLGSKQDARLAAEQGRLKGSDAAETAVTGVNGAIQQPLPDLAPGATVELTYAIGVGSAEGEALSEARSALQTGWPALTDEEAARWSSVLSAARTPDMPAKERAVYRRAVIALTQHEALNGATIAAPTNLTPAYRLAWVRDGAINALTMLDLGFEGQAKHFFEFIERMQKPSGGWAINFFPDGSSPLWDFGTNGNEHDEVGTFVWGVERVYQKTGDQGWLAARYPAVQKACSFLISQQEPSGLLSRCRDLWELSTDGTWTYTNAAGWAGLTAGAAIAERLGHPAEAATYRAAADRLHRAMETQLVADGSFARGLRKRGLDRTSEVANLALGSQWFGAFPETDPRMRATADWIATRLVTPMGGIKRYEGDTY
ncbi:MAG TPA: glycoside hydrolase family 15 protein, partial [Stenomitos sp.]